MKKVITIILIVVIVIVGYVIFENRSELGKVSVSDPKVNDVAQSDVQIDSWSTYTNPKYGIEFVYPSEFTAEESTGYPTRISFESPKVKLGSMFELTVYDTKRQSNITSLDTIPRLTKIDTDREILNTSNITNANSVPVQVVKGVQYSFKNGKPDKNYPAYTLSILFMKGQNAFALNWECWANTACFNDGIVSKLVDSIKLK